MHLNRTCIGRSYVHNRTGCMFGRPGIPKFDQVRSLTSLLEIFEDIPLRYIVLNAFLSPFSSR